MSSLALPMRPASALMSPTTPAKLPVPFAARVAWMVALSASALVCAAMLGDRAHDRVDLAWSCCARLLGARRGRLRRGAAQRDDVGGLPDALDRLGDRRAQPLGRRAHRRDVRHGVLRDERRLDRLAFGDRRHAGELARGLVHGLDAVGNAQQHRAHDPVEPADRVLERLAALLDALGMRDVGAQPVALLQRALQHDDGARDVADLVGALDAGHLGLPVAARDRAHRLGDLHQRPADALRRPAA